MKRYPSRCPVCNGHIVKEYYGDYGRVHRINKDGSPAKRYRNIIYEVHGEDDYIVYCEDCGRTIYESNGGGSYAD